MIELLKKHLKELTGEDWVVEDDQVGWDIQFTFTLRDFKCKSESLYLKTLTRSKLKEEAEMVALVYQRR